MASISVEGGVPLVGSLEVSGSKNSSVKLVYASMFSNEDVTISNVPRISRVEEDLEIVRSVGAKAQWVSENSLVLNGSGINSYELSSDVGRKNRTSLLLAGPLIYRYGKASLPKIKDTSFKTSPINRFLDTWEGLGIEISETKDHYLLDGKNLSPGDVSFKHTTRMGTESAILSALCVNGEVNINNASEDCEVDELLKFLKTLGANVSRTDTRKIKVSGKTIFRGGSFKVGPDREDALVFLIGALITNGNVTVKGVDREEMSSFVSLLMKIGGKFEFVNDGLKVWSTGEKLNSTNVTIAAPPGLVSEWQPLITLLLSYAEGESTIYDTVYYDRFDYVKDLNRMGAQIDITKPSEVGLESIVTDDSYLNKDEPSTVIKTKGPVKLRPARLDVSDPRYGAVLVLAALSAVGKSELFNAEKIEESFQEFYGRLKELGAKIDVLNI